MDDSKPKPSSLLTGLVIGVIVGLIVGASGMYWYNQRDLLMPDEEIEGEVDWGKVFEEMPAVPDVSDADTTDDEYENPFEVSPTPLPTPTDDEYVNPFDLLVE